MLIPLCFRDRMLVQRDFGVARQSVAEIIERLETGRAKGLLFQCPGAKPGADKLVKTYLLDGV